jgi:hypothetical protein
MKKLAILLAVALEIAACGCATNNTNQTSTITTTANGGFWQAQLTGGTGQASLLNFNVSFSVNTTGPIDVTGFSFFNDGACFSTTANSETISGNTTLSTANNGTVTGPFTMTVKSNTNSNSLQLKGILTGTSNGSTTTTGTLSNGVVIGNWTLTSTDASCNPNTGNNSNGLSGNFVMCQGASTCSTTSLP